MIRTGEGFDFEEGMNVLLWCPEKNLWKGGEKWNLAGNFWA
jgi:hypothetical protein